MVGGGHCQQKYPKYPVTISGTRSAYCCGTTHVADVWQMLTTQTDNCETLSKSSIHRAPWESGLQHRMVKIRFLTKPFFFFGGISIIILDPQTSRLVLCVHTASRAEQLYEESFPCSFLTDLCQKWTPFDFLHEIYTHFLETSRSKG